VAGSTVLAGAVTPASAAEPVYEKKTPPLSTPWTAEVGPDNALPEYPRPQMTREAWQNLNGVWQFREATRFGDGVPSGQDLEERILVPYPVESGLSGIQRSVDRMWYRRTFEVPKDWKVGAKGNQQRLLMHFGAVDYDATVYVNGQLATTHKGGYDKFSVDVTDHLERSGEQEVIVGVEDLTDQTFQAVGKQRERSDGGIFYQGSSGIWQTVWMEPVPSAGIEDLEMTPDLETSTLALTANVPGATSQQVEAVATDRETGVEVGRVTGPANTQLSVPVPDAKLWSPDSPTLYDLTVKVLERGRAVDTVGSYFGMRSVEVSPGADGRNRIKLNGEVLFNNSTLDQGFWPDGLNTAPTDEGLRFDLELHKRLGFNTVRKHIKVEPDRWYAHADELGLLVWQDMPAMKNGVRPPPAAQVQYEAELDQMIQEKKSWTSIVAWVPFNEGWGEWSRDATGRIADEIKAADPSRLVDAHSGVNCCESLGDSGKGDMVDHHQYVGPASSPHPDANRVAVDGEHGGLGLRTPGHEWFTDGRSFAYEMTESKTDLTRRYVEVANDLKGLADSCALSASIYTQVTDVEAEVNGFITYDRQVEKMDFDQVRAINEEVTASADGSGNTAPPSLGTPGIAGVHAYQFDEGSGTVAGDSVGDADAVLTNVGWAEGVEGTAGSFGGNSEGDTGEQLVDPRGSYSVSAWAKLDEAGGAFQTVVSQDTGNASAFFLQYSGADQRWAMSFVGARALSPTKPEVGRWYHLTGVRDAQAGTLSLYVDGEKVGTQSACSAGEGNGNTVIGRGQFDGDQVDYLRGDVDDLRVFDRAISAQEARELYTDGR